MPADRVDVAPSASSRSASRSFLTICSGVCLLPFMRVTSSPTRAIVTLTTAGPVSGGQVTATGGSASGTGGGANANGGGATTGAATVDNTATVSQSLMFDLSGLTVLIDAEIDA